MPAPSTDEPPAPVPPRRLAIVVASYAPAASPAGIDLTEFREACLVDSYEVTAALLDVGSGIVGDGVDDLLWPDAVRLSVASGAGLAGIADAAATRGFDELVLLPADVPDLPGLVLAKLFKVLHRVDVAVAPQRGGDGCVALGLALPLADWIPRELLDLDRNPYGELRRLARRSPELRGRCVLSPDWHRLRAAADLDRLDPRLEGWESTRLLLGLA
jgi:hypothetical protein